MRIAWFILGTLFGMSCTSGMHWLLSNHAGQDMARQETSAASTSAKKQAAAPKKAPTAKPVASRPEPPAPTHLSLKVNKGDTLMDMLTRNGLAYVEAHNVIAALRKEYDPRRLVVGQQVEMHLTGKQSGDMEYALESLRIRMSPVETLALQQTAKDRFRINTEKAKLDTHLSSGGGTIRSSLYQTGVDTGVPPAILGTLINAYSYDVDFQREIRSGDQFNVVFEELKTEDDSTAGYGRLLYATLTLGGAEKRLYHFTRENGEEGFYDSTGQSVRKALLRTPINGARLSSGFGMRHHPVLGYGKMHKGVDFAAPTGTPIYAAGDGTIDYASRHGSYGNYVRIRHNNQYATAYAHMHRISVKKGQRVKQGDVIGTVGTTGRSTGPHLHYEVLSHGNQVNPKDIKFPTGHTLQGTELAMFRENIKQIDLIASRLIDGESHIAQAE